MKRHNMKYCEQNQYNNNHYLDHVVRNPIGLLDKSSDFVVFV